jgi:hypothetical protein
VILSILLLMLSSFSFNFLCWFLLVSSLAYPTCLGLKGFVVVVVVVLDSLKYYLTVIQAPNELLLFNLLSGRSIQLRGHNTKVCHISVFTH